MILGSPWLLGSLGCEAITLTGFRFSLLKGSEDLAILNCMVQQKILGTWR